ncbi:MAG: putative L,D-transpeptidase YkuD [Pelotomaculum sp. PtaB.Bin013]|uniref:Peptidoglycan-binding protein n=1 Tax=Pelotomaculum isophthalicicum JI TaxID=947010 RepID=A0A9X4GXL0_9FIRM|nr:peptidoglycan-binding protein [Pelotomaculum isophthalicicum]MDF9406905.1 peptidoglycan-binding protein [Pelotomaculum isophthalicicum JI]OPX91031.1 MAG: putative L,D-transpeptidase YkuD [Pelotomaculum sp. PtaB.Bin013]
MLYASRYLRIMDPLMEGPDVQYVQKRLKELGFYTGPANGVYSPETRDAVIRAQQNFGLTADGVVGPDTYNALGLSPKDDVTVAPEYVIIIDTRTLQLSLRQFGREIGVFPVAVGTPNTPTPLGDWKIIQKTKNPGGPFGVRWMRLNCPWGGYGIHGTDNEASIGSAASHGCIRMRNDDITRIYELVPLGTRVKITGDAFTGRLLRIGVEPGSDVLRVQQILQMLGYYRGDLDGFYGPATESAVVQFQRAQGLSPDGIVGPLTYDRLQLANDLVLGDRRP